MRACAAGARALALGQQRPPDAPTGGAAAIALLGQRCGLSRRRPRAGPQCPQAEALGRGAVRGRARLLDDAGPPAGRARRRRMGRNAVRWAARQQARRWNLSRLRVIRRRSRAGAQCPCARQNRSAGTRLDPGVRKGPTAIQHRRRYPRGASRQAIPSPAVGRRAGGLPERAEPPAGVRRGTLLAVDGRPRPRERRHRSSLPDRHACLALRHRPGARARAWLTGRRCAICCAPVHSLPLLGSRTARWPSTSSSSTREPPASARHRLRPAEHAARTNPCAARRGTCKAPPPLRVAALRSAADYRIPAVRRSAATANAL